MPKRVAVVGGGFAGILAALRLGRNGHCVTLLDENVFPTSKKLGGFAEFSGAKFSMLPAGEGLASVTGSVESVQVAVCQVLKELDLDDSQSDSVANGCCRLGSELHFRSYKSIVLSPDRMSSLLLALTERLQRSAAIEVARVTRLTRHHQNWLVLLENGKELIADSVIYAGGRGGGDLLASAGAEPQVGKGIDVGVRLNFMDRRALAPLRSLGADAKILSGYCRTFCLNHPGRIYRYPFDGYSIPGGVVADPNECSANVGVLLRVREKAAILRSTREFVVGNRSRGYDGAELSRDRGLADKRVMVGEAWGEVVARELEIFLDALSQENLLDLTEPHEVLWPLLDWHWPVFALPGGFRTTQERLYVAGDSAGHARGLLQAAVSGWLVAEIVNNETE